MCQKHDIDVQIPYSKLSPKDREKVLYGVSGTYEVTYVSKFDEGKAHKAKYEGLIPNLERRYRESDMSNDAFFKRISTFATEQVCRTCVGHRLKKEYLSVLI